MSFGEYYGAAAGLGNAYSQGLEEYRKKTALSKLGEQLKLGDYGGAATTAFNAGDAGTGIGLLKLGETRRQAQLEETNAQTVGGLLSGTSGATPSLSGGGASKRMPADPAIEQRFIGALKDGGLTNPNGLSAVAAYANHESGYGQDKITGSWSDPSESGQPGTSGGILSWRGDRLANMQRATAGAADPVVAQAKFLLSENPNLTQALQNAKSPEEANRLMAEAWRFAGYDRPGGENAARLASTRGYLGRLNGGGSPTQVASADPDAPVAGAQPVGFQIPGEGAPVPPQVQAATRGLLAMPVGDRIPRLLQMSSMRLPEAMAGTVKTLLQDSLSEAKMPDEVKGFIWARANGLTEARNPKEYARDGSAEAGPVSVAPGNTLVDRKTLQPVYTAPDRDKSTEGEAKLRGEFTKQLGTFSDVQDGYRRLIAATEQREANPDSISPASDIGLIFGYMKMLDPGSVVREGEYATAQNAAGIPTRVQNAYNKALSGEFLTPEQRQDFIDTAGRLYGQARQGAEGVAGRYRDLAKGQGLDQNRVVALPDALSGPKVARRAAPSQPVKVTTPDEARRLPKGTPIILPDGRTGVVP